MPRSHDINRRHFLKVTGSGFAAAFLMSVPTRSYAAQDPVYTSFLSSVAINGYDPVAYFKAGKPVEGSKDHKTEWMGATWYFSSKENLDTFIAMPETFAPQYGGYCAWAVAQGDTASTDPHAWKIVDNKLYLNYSADIQSRWERDITGNIQKGDNNWPTVLND
ncbi:YHS domain-containing (seleno)protein [Kiloniella majae]|uniref:YHS domain-containing (seleno)protein n=1 Tax=Kiloniella majae TaxID=1938558 RepID=UPI000A279892|nr:YHS domain-containing (seleno)protein [Kiloniella majae]